ncbi:MAG: SUF system Fe-S cluster assembly protein [Myxococcota bacterium]
MLNWIRDRLGLGKTKDDGAESPLLQTQSPTNQQGSSAMHDDQPTSPEPSTESASPSQTSPQAVSGAPDAPDAPGVSDLSPAMQIRDRIIAVLKTVYDPEIPVDIYELGLVYGVDVNDDAEVNVTMTLTTPMCPVAETLPVEVEDKVRNVLGVKDVNLDLVWDPPWSVDMMSDAARLELNMM